MALHDNPRLCVSHGKLHPGVGFPQCQVFAIDPATSYRQTVCRADPRETADHPHWLQTALLLSRDAAHTLAANHVPFMRASCRNAGAQRASIHGLTRPSIRSLVDPAWLCCGIFANVDHPVLQKWNVIRKFDLELNHGASAHMLHSFSVPWVKNFLQSASLSRTRR